MKHANVTYIENEVSKKMKGEIEEANNAIHPKGSPKFEFHLFQARTGTTVNDEPTFSLEFVVQSQKTPSNLETIIYKSSYFLGHRYNEEKINAASEFLYKQFQLSKNVGFLSMTLANSEKYPIQQ